MGEILRHAEIHHDTREKLAGLRTDEEYTYLELGNFLTDVSQFRDPFANMLAKRTIWAQAKRSNLFLAIVSAIPIISILSDVILDALDVEEWVDQLMGGHEPPERRYGKLAEYFQAVMLGVTHVVFADDIPKKEAVRAMLPAHFRALEPIPPAELERVFARFFTQYYPHEHTDYPPYVIHGEQRAYHRMYQRGSRGVIRFVEEYLQCLSEELSKVELLWKERRSDAKTSTGRHDVLVAFGKLLHAVEDYFFHSNYVELHLWNSERRRHPSSLPEEEFRTRFARDALRAYGGYPGYTGYDLAGDGPEGLSPTTRRRKLMRRLRYPVYRPVNELSTSESLPSLNLAYPGGFESKDMLHTMAGALESMEALLVGFDQSAAHLTPEMRAALGIPSTGRLRDSELVLMRTLFNAEERTRMDRDEEYMERQMVLHIEQINSDVYPRGIGSLHTAGYLNAGARDAFLRMFAIDRGVEAMHSRTPGCGGFLIKFLAQAQGEVNRSRREARRLDSEHTGRPNEGNVLDERTDNGVSGEAIGTHTLLSKDTPKSQPLHEDAEVLAKYASMAITRIMLSEVNDNPDLSTGSD